MKLFCPEDGAAVSFAQWHCTPKYTVLQQLPTLLSLQKNIVHRDLKLGNLVLNRRTHRVTITNFCLGKHLGSENDLLKDQRGSPAYISPDVLCGKPYLGE
jgi:serine/threonine protein kinase